MRQLASAMIQDTDVQIVITEASINAERSSSSTVETQPSIVAMHISTASTSTIKAMTSLGGKVPTSGTQPAASASSQSTRPAEINSTVAVPCGQTSADLQTASLPCTAFRTGPGTCPVRDNDGRHVSIMSTAANGSATVGGSAEVVSVDVCCSQSADNAAFQRTSSTRSQVVQALNSTQSMRRKHQTDRTTRMVMCFCQPIIRYMSGPPESTCNKNLKNFIQPIRSFRNTQCCHLTSKTN